MQVRLTIYAKKYLKVKVKVLVRDHVVDYVMKSFAGSLFSWVLFLINRTIKAQKWINIYVLLFFKTDNILTVYLYNFIVDFFVW